MERMGAPAGESGIEMAEVFADDAVLVRRIHILAEALELVEEVASVEGVQLRQESGQRSQFFESPMEFAEGREAG